MERDAVTKMPPRKRQWNERKSRKALEKETGGNGAKPQEQNSLCIYEGSTEKEPSYHQLQIEKNETPMLPNTADKCQTSVKPTDGSMKLSEHLITPSHNSVIYETSRPKKRVSKTRGNDQALKVTRHLSNEAQLLFDNSYPEPANNIETTSNPPQCNTGWRGEPDSEGSPNIKINSSAKYPTSSFHTSPARVHRPATGLKSPKGPSQLNMAFDLNFNQLPKYDFLLRKAQNRQNNQITPSTNIFLDTSSASLSVVAGNGGQSESTSLQDNPDIPLKEDQKLAHQSDNMALEVYKDDPSKEHNHDMKADTQKPLALAVNKAKGNADLQKPQKRSDKAPYLPPHLRVLLGEKSVGEHRDAIKPTPISTNSDRHDTNTTMKPSPATSVVADHPDTNTSLSSSKPVAGLPPHLRVMETVQKNDEAKVIGDIRVKLPPHLRVLNEHREGSSIIHPTIHGKSSPVPTEINATTSSEPVVHKMSSSGQLSGDENLHITQNVVMPASESLAAQSVVEDPKEDVARVRFESSPTDVLLDAPKETGKLVQELATNEPPLVDPGFTGANLLNRGKNKNASLLADNGLTKGLEDDKSVGSDGLTKSTVEEVKVDARGFEIPSKKAALRYQLVGWDGNWAPAPVEWDCRPAFNNNDRRHVRYMELWMHDRVVEALHRPLKLDTTLPGYTSGECPSSGRAGFLWRPYPVDWTTKRPDDPYTNVPEHLAQTSLSSSKAFCKVHYAEKKKRHEERRLAKEASLLEEANYVPPPNPHVPKANIYIRPAQHSDVEQITAIYNHYVKNSPVAGELENTPESEWRNRLRCAEDELLPFVVAVIKNAKNFNNAVGGRNGRRVVRRRAPIREVIVGFAYAEDYAGKNTAFQYTAEMQFFTHHEFLHMGIGKTLVDRMIVSMDQAYSSRNGAAFLADSPLYYEHGGRREIHRIMVNVGFYTKDPHAMKWIKDWLGKEWDFEHVGTLPGVGYKDNKHYNIALLMKETNVICGISIWPE